MTGILNDKHFVAVHFYTFKRTGRKGSINLLNDYIQQPIAMFEYSLNLWSLNALV